MADESQKQPQQNQNRQQPGSGEPQRPQQQSSYSAGGGQNKPPGPPPPPPRPEPEEDKEKPEKPPQEKPQPSEQSKQDQPSRPEPNQPRQEPRPAALEPTKKAPPPSNIPVEPAAEPKQEPAPKPETVAPRPSQDDVRPQPAQRQPQPEQERPRPSFQPMNRQASQKGPESEPVEPKPREDVATRGKPSGQPARETPSSLPASQEQPLQEQDKGRIRQQPAPFEPSQKKNLLSRGEVHTMNKDVSQLREQEAKKEQERISQLKSQQEIEQEREAVQKIRQSAQQTKKQEEASRREQLRRIQSSILPPGEEQRVQTLPKRPSSNRKVFIRIIFVIIFAFVALNLLLFGYWFFFQRESAQLPFVSQEPEGQQQDPSPAPAPLPEPAPQPTPSPVSPSAPESLVSLVSPSHTLTVQFSSAEELSGSLADVLQESQAGGFTHLILRNREDTTQITSANALLSLFDVSVPEQVTPHLSEQAAFFSHATENGNRFGMLVSVQNPQQVMEAFGQWEPQMEEAFSPLFPFWGQPGTGYADSFRAVSHQGVDLRLQTFSTQDYGIVYGVVDSYLILASSFGSARAVIEALQASALSVPRPTVLASLVDPNDFRPPPVLSAEQEIGQTLLVGFEGSTLTPELEDFMKRLQPGGVLLLSRNIKNANQLMQLTQDLQRVSLTYSQLPLFIAVDQEGDPISRVSFAKEKTAQSSIKSSAQAFEIGYARGQELQSFGINLNLSPVLDHTMPSDFLFDRTFQREGEKAGKLAVSFVRGQQEAGILSTLKHFPGYGNISFNPEKKLASVPNLPDTSSFRSAFGSNPEFVLTSNAIYEELNAEVPFTFSSEGISLIRSQFGFSGIILSDDLSQPSLLNTYALETIVTAPLQAGVTMIMLSEEPYATKAYELLQDKVQTDTELKKSIEDSAARVVALKKAFFGALPPVPPEHLSQNK